MSWIDELGRFAHRGLLEAEEQYDELMTSLRERLGNRDPIMIQPYRGFGTPDELWLKGRILQDEGIADPHETDTALENLVAMALRFETDEIPGARIVATAHGAQEHVRSDEEGYFEVRLRPEPPASSVEEHWREVLLEAPGLESDSGPVEATGLVRIPHPDARFGVISDIDDTVLRTGAQSLWTLARSTLLGNARTRYPFEGVAAFYRALEAGSGNGDAPPNPFFYVSSSPWNLYDFLEDFFALNDLPPGPLLLRDLGLDETKFIKGGHDHKLEKIERILSTYPDLPFILIGDSGQEDPELYRQAIEDFPGRIRVIYIRDVSEDSRDEEVARLVDEAKEQHVDMLLVPDTIAAAEHAADLDLIDVDRLPGIRAAKRADE